VKCGYTTNRGRCATTEAIPRSARGPVERARVVGVSKAPDPALMNARAGSRDWSAIFSQYYPVMYAAAASVLKGQTALGVDADDIVSIALGEAISKGLTPGVEQLHSYLARIARLRAIDALRRRKHQAGDPPDPGTESAARIATDGPEELAILSELASEIAAHLDKLPERERVALEGTILRDRPRAEVAAVLGVTPQRVSQLVGAALGRLRQLPPFADGSPFDTEESGGSTSSSAGTRP
jgi:RNA polymerase sigma factor (sigma-70 family)